MGNGQHRSHKREAPFDFYGYRDNGGNNPTVIDVELKGYTSVGTYQLGDTSRQASLLYNNVRYDAATGEVKVTQDDASLFRATFNLRRKIALIPLGKRHPESLIIAKNKAMTFYHRL